MRRRDALLALLVALIWGVNFVIADIGVASVPPLLFTALRFTLVALPAVLRRERRLACRAGGGATLPSIRQQSVRNRL